MTKSIKLFSSLIFLLSVGCGHAQENSPKKLLSASPEKKITVKLCGEHPDEIWLNLTKSKTETFPSLLQLDQKTPNRQFNATTVVQADAALLGVYSNSYKFHPGDSICVEFVKNPKGRYKLPFLSITNRKFNTYELNFYYYLNNNRLGINNYDFSSLKEKGTSKQSLIISKQYLDSLHNKNLIDEPFWKETATELDYMYYNVLLSDYRKGEIQAIKEIPALAYNNDDLIENWVYRGFLIKYLELFVMKSKNWGDIDYASAYAKASTNFTGNTREYLMYYALNKSNTKDKSKFNSLLADFKSKVKDKEYQAAISKNYSGAKAITKPGKAIIESFVQASQDYNKFISSQKGKVVYVDLWASWCSPCRSAMKDSHNLRKKYSAKNISFVYLSIDEKRTAWEEASKEENLADYRFSFLLKDVKESPLLKILGVKSIPRYILYDANGKLVDGDAPNPGSKDLEKILNKYLTD